MVTDKQLIYKNEARAAVLHENPSIVHCIDRVKVVDAAEVTRCKDCKYYTSELDNGENDCSLSRGLVFAKPDDFCSLGRRVE